MHFVDTLLTRWLWNRLGLYISSKMGGEGAENKIAMITDFCKNAYIAVSICHLERQRDDGGGGVVRPHTWGSFPPHASRIQHDDRHVCGLRA